MTICFSSNQFNRLTISWNNPLRTLKTQGFQCVLIHFTLAIVWMWGMGSAWAGPLSDRLDTFPDWHTKPPVRIANGDLVYPDWFAGTWQMTSTLVDMVAPLAPDLVTPGFEGNRQFLYQPITAPIRFVSARVERGRFLGQPIKAAQKIVSDRAFNGLSLGRAYLGDDGINAVKVDPDNPNRQITFLKGNQQLISTVTGRAVEQPNNTTFMTTEVFQQFFSGNRPTIYLNEVENTTVYHYHDSATPITADQITAIYLSPQDPDYFRAINQPVALYRYRLTFQRSLKK